MRATNPENYPSWQRRVILCRQCPDFVELQQAIFDGKRRAQAGIVASVVRH